MGFLSQVRTVLSRDQLRYANFIDLSHCGIDYAYFVCYGIVPYFNRIVPVDLSNNEPLSDYEFGQFLQCQGPHLKFLELNYIQKVFTSSLTIIR